MTKHKTPKKPPKYFSLLWIPPSGKKSYTYRLNQRTLVWVVVLVVCLIGYGAGGAYWSIHKNVKSKEFVQLKQLTNTQAKTIAELNQEVDSLKDGFKAIIDKKEEMFMLLGETRIKRHLRTKRRTLKKKKDRSKNDLSATIVL